MQVIDKNLKDGKLLSITFRVDSDYENTGYRKLPGIQTCPHCGKPVNPKDEDLLLIVPTPLEPTIPGASMDLGVAVTKCSSCGKQVRDKDQCDIMSFPEVRTYVTKLRKAYEAAKQKAKKGGAKGGKKG